MTRLVIDFSDGWYSYREMFAGEDTRNVVDIPQPTIAMWEATLVMVGVMQRQLRELDNAISTEGGLVSRPANTTQGMSMEVAEQMSPLPTFPDASAMALDRKGKPLDPFTPLKTPALGVNPWDPSNGDRFYAETPDLLGETVDLPRAVEVGGSLTESLVLPPPSNASDLIPGGEDRSRVNQWAELAETTVHVSRDTAHVYATLAMVDELMKLRAILVRGGK